MFANMKLKTLFYEVIIFLLVEFFNKLLLISRFITQRLYKLNLKKVIWFPKAQTTNPKRIYKTHKKFEFSFLCLASDGSKIIKLDLFHRSFF